MNNKQIEMINIDLIIPNRFQPRLTFDDSALQELANSIKEHGIIQPLVLRQVNDKYEIIAGERRYKAAQLAGLTEVPAIINNIDDNESAEVALIENVQRRNLNSMEEAKSYKKILDRGNLTQEALAKKMGISQSTLANKLRLLNLAPEVQEALMQGKISERHARSLLMVNDNLAEINLLNRVINERLTVRQLDAIIKGKSLDNEPHIENNIKEEPIMNESIEQLDVMPSLNPTNNNLTDFNFIQNNNIDNSQINDDNSIDSAVSMIDSLDTLDELDDNSSANYVNTLPSDKTEESAPSYINNFFDKITGSNYSSLEDETVNMNFDTNEMFNPFNSLNVAESMPVKEENVQVIDTFEENNEQEMPKYNENVVIPGDLSSIKMAYDNLKKEIENAGFKISVEEFDFEDIYQLIIKVNKDI